MLLGANAIVARQVIREDVGEVRLFKGDDVAVSIYEFLDCLALVQGHDLPIYVVLLLLFLDFHL